MRLGHRWRLWMLMAIVAAVGLVLPAIKERGPGWLEGYRKWQKNRPVHALLQRPISLRYPNGVPLEQMLLHVITSTKDPPFSSGLPIYIDPTGLQEAGQTM